MVNLYLVELCSQCGAVCTDWPIFRIVVVITDIDASRCSPLFLDGGYELAAVETDCFCKLLEDSQVRSVVLSITTSNEDRCTPSSNQK